jgi:exosortase/archaeosortase family protein
MLLTMENTSPPPKTQLYTLLRVTGIASIIAITLYYLPDYFMVEKVTALHSAILMELIGIKATVWYQGSRVFLNEFEIQRMCTGVQVITVFLGLIVAMPKIALKKRLLAFGVVAVSVYLANIGRIALEIWLLYNGILPWDLAHYPTGLILGIFSVAFLVVAADHFIPEIGDMALSALDGFRRT